MKSSNKRFLSLLASLLLLVAAIFVYSLLVAPAYQEINKLRGDLASKADALEAQQEISKQTKTLLDQYQSDLAGLQNTISLAMPIGIDYQSLVNQINGLTKNFNLLLVSLDFNLLPIAGQSATGVVKNTAPAIVQLKLQLKGQYQPFKDFLRALETNIRIIDLANLTIVPDEKGQNFSYNVVANTYYQP